MTYDEAVYKVEGIGAKRVHRLNEVKGKKRLMLMHEETREELKDFLYGSGKNPFEGLNKEYESYIEEYDQKVEDIIDSTLRTLKKEKINK